MTDPSTLDRLASYFSTTDLVLCLWIMAISLVLLVGVFSLGIRWVKWK